MSKQPQTRGGKFIPRICGILSAVMVAAGTATLGFLLATGRDGMVLFAVPATFFGFAALFIVFALIAASGRGKVGMKVGLKGLEFNASAANRLRSNRATMKRVSGADTMGSADQVAPDA